MDARLFYLFQWQNCVCVCNKTNPYGFATSTLGKLRCVEYPTFSLQKIGGLMGYETPLDSLPWYGTFDQRS